MANGPTTEHPPVEDTIARIREEHELLRSAPLLDRIIDNALQPLDIANGAQPEPGQAVTVCDFRTLGQPGEPGYIQVGYNFREGDNLGDSYPVFRSGECVSSADFSKDDHRETERSLTEVTLRANSEGMTVAELRLAHPVSGLPLRVAISRATIQENGERATYHRLNITSPNLPGAMAATFGEDWVVLDAESAHPGVRLAAEQISNLLSRAHSTLSESEAIGLQAAIDPVIDGALRPEHPAASDRAARITYDVQYIDKADGVDMVGFISPPTTPRQNMTIVSSEGAQPLDTASAEVISEVNTVLAERKNSATAEGSTEIAFTADHPTSGRALSVEATRDVQEASESDHRVKTNVFVHALGRTASLHVFIEGNGGRILARRGDGSKIPFTEIASIDDLIKIFDSAASATAAER